MLPLSFKDFPNATPVPYPIIPERLQGRVFSLDAARRYRADGCSLRDTAKAVGIPKSTLSYHENKQTRMPPETYRFFTSPVGASFIHDMITACIVIFVIGKECGSRGVARLVQQLHLDSIVAGSHTSWADFIGKVEKGIISFGSTENHRLGQNLDERPYVFAVDETFFPDICLVGIEARSGFIITETFAEDRSAATWSDAWKQSTADFPRLNAVGIASDGAKGILAFADMLGAFHSPDLFHVEHDYCKALNFKLIKEEREAQKSVEDATLELGRVKDEIEAAAKAPRGPGRPPNCQPRIAEAEQALGEANKCLEVATGRRTRLRDTLRAISGAHHPVDLVTGERRGRSVVERDLRKAHAAILMLAEDVSLRERGMELIHKAERQISALAETIALFSAAADTLASSLGLHPAEVAAFHRFLVTSSYLDRVAPQMTSDERSRMRQLAESLRTQGRSALSGRSETFFRDVLESAEDAAYLFQRSSSCVEGRNGHLSLCHHSGRGLSKSRMAALTVLANYYQRRPDGTTAAERFFRAPHCDLFAHLQENLLPLPRAGGRHKQETRARS